MKTSHRHHLKENDLVQTIAAAREYLNRRGRHVGLALVAVLVVAAIVGGLRWYRQQQAAQGEDLLAAAMVVLNTNVVPVSAGEAAQPGDVPAAASIAATGTFATEAAKLSAALPKLKAAAEAYPDSPAGITARYHLASVLASLARQDEAATAFDEVIRRAGSESLYGRMALLGKADSQSKAGQVDEAIATWKSLATSTDELLPKDAILMELGRAYRTKGSVDDARKTFTELVDDHPNSPYTAEAKKELESLKG